MGPTGIGSGDDDDSTNISPGITSLYMRHTFDIQDTSSIEWLFFNMDYDDGFVAYINGKEIARENIGTPGSHVQHNQTALANVEPLADNNTKPAAYAISKDSISLVPGPYVLSVQVHDARVWPENDMTALPFLTIGSTDDTGPGSALSSFLDFSIAAPHTNFKVDAKDETVYLFNPQGEIIDSLACNEITAGISIGKFPYNPDSIGMFLNPTPGKQNAMDMFTEMADTLYPLQPDGIYSSSVTIDFPQQSTDQKIFFTLDGSKPKTQSDTFTTSFITDTSVILKYFVTEPGKLPSPTRTVSYLLNIEHSLPIISIQAEPHSLFDYYEGIYVEGPNNYNSYPYFEANFWRDWEIPCHVDFFKNNNLEFEQDLGLQIFGGWSRANDQRPFAFFARGQYGDNDIDYPLFDDLSFDSYTSFILRTGGNDWNETMLRDAIIGSLADGLDIEKQAVSPVVAYLNGEFWGIYNMREKINEEFIAQHRKTNPDKIDQLFQHGIVIEGSNIHYFNMLDFIEQNDIRNQDIYNQVKNMMDVKNFVDYYAIQIYSANYDWPGHNIKCWRNQTETGRWRWLFYDIDGVTNNKVNKIDKLLTTTDIDYSNPRESTFLFRNMVKNKDFKRYFINRFADLLNTLFTKENLMEQIDYFSSKYYPELDHQIERWGNFSKSKFDNEIQKLKDFAGYRTTIQQTHINNSFHLGGKVDLEIQLSHENAGYVQLNTLSLNDFPFNGVYFKGVPVTMEVFAKPGYEFIGWDIYENSSSAIEIDLAGNTTVTAMFKKVENTGGSIVINEIERNPCDEMDAEDWIELMNNSHEGIDLSGWKLMDNNDSTYFMFPKGTHLKAGEFLVVSEALEDFKLFYPNVPNVIGDLPFGLNAESDMVRLYDDNDQLIDAFGYQSLNWPDAARENCKTLALLNPNLNNALYTSWDDGPYKGTPGRPNTGNKKFEEAVETTGVLTEQISDFEIKTYPNPFQKTINIEINVQAPADAQIIICNVHGKTVTKLTHDKLLGGYHTFEWNPGPISSGVYLLKVVTPRGSTTKKIIKH
ncbi:MAG: T9SS type A sorting domain-containing protein [Bacteroidetes bacterium]|jgi:hypothetical protein|nr:T9SS type A sorting domain-containing protein [Bacteroidota bacterium]